VLTYDGTSATIAVHFAVPCEAALKCRFVTVSDIDECSNRTNECNTTSTKCVNEPGSYSCTCLPGFYGPAGSRSCNGIYRDRCVFLFRTLNTIKIMGRTHFLWYHITIIYVQVLLHSFTCKCTFIRKCKVIHTIASKDYKLAAAKSWIV